MFSNEVNYLMENSISPSLNLLLEEDPAFGDEALDKEDEKEEKEKKQDKDVGDEVLDSDSDDEVELPDDTQPSDSGEAGSAKDENIEQLAQGIDNLKNYLTNISSDSTGLFSIQKYIGSQVSALSNEVELDDSDNVRESYSLGRKNKISYFLNEKTNVKDVEKDIEVIDNIIDKGTTLIDKFKKGTKINIMHYVESSINAYRNFDNLFSKESIIKQAAMNLILLNSGAKAEENIREYEELFHEELHKQFGIEYEEHAIITKPHHTATGAVKQG